MQQFFYDEQIRRFLLQFTRIFSNFQVEYSRDENGNPTYLRVPIRYGDSSRQVQNVLQSNSANIMTAAPLMSFYVTGLSYDRARMQEPYHVSKMNVRQRTWDTETDSYELTQGNAFTIERLMPVPYTLSITLDIWTTNTNQKFQLLEQIAPLFNPSLEIQSTDNYIDWTSLSVVELDGDGVTWSNRSIPTGTDDQIDIASMKFKLPIWISSPAKVKKLGVVEKIIASVFDGNGDLSNALINNDLLLGTRQAITPFGYEILLLGREVQILKGSTPNSITGVDESSSITWNTITDQYSGFRSGISQLRITDNRLDTEIVGTVATHPTDPRLLLFTIDPDTLPSNTLSPINAIVDPLRSGPGHGLPTPSLGTRYLLVNDIGSEINQEPSIAWGNLVAKANDIVEWGGSDWQVAFNSSETLDPEYVTNITTEIQYVWINAQWVKSYQGMYRDGDWSLVF